MQQIGFSPWDILELNAWDHLFSEMRNDSRFDKMELVMMDKDIMEYDSVQLRSTSLIIPIDLKGRSCFSPILLSEVVPEILDAVIDLAYCGNEMAASSRYKCNNGFYVLAHDNPLSKFDLYLGIRDSFKILSTHHYGTRSSQEVAVYLRVDFAIKEKPACIRLKNWCKSYRRALDAAISSVIK